MAKASRFLAAGVLVWALMLVGNSCVRAQGEKAHKNVLKSVNAILADINLKATDAWATPFGMYEVIVENKQGKKRVVFFSSDLKYYIVGRVFTSGTNEDITFLEAYKQGVLPPPKGIKVDPKSINLKNAVLSEGKEGARDAILFADPLDPISREEILVLKSLGFNVYVKLVPVYGPPSVKAFVYLLRLKKEKPEKVIEALAFSPEKIQEIVDKSKGIDPTDKKYAAEAKEVDANQKEAALLGIKGVPAFVIDGRLYKGYMGKRLMQFLLAHEQ